MEAYVRLDKRKDDNPIQENEVRIMATNKMRNYITYAITLLTEKGYSSVQLKAMGRAINKTVTIAEIIKRRVKGLHQVTEIGSVNITDTWEPKEEGLSRLEITRHVSVITVTLSPEPLDVDSPGYQAPLSDELVRPVQPADVQRRPRRGRGRRPSRGRGDGGNNRSMEGGEQRAPRPNNDGAPYGSGRGRGRGRGGRGRGRGAGGNNEPNGNAAGVHGPPPS